MRYVIYGAGAIGSTIGARLHAAGHDVLLIARGTHLEALKSDGLRLQTPEGESVHRLPVIDGPNGITDDDVVLLAMKTQDTLPALQALSSVADPVVVCAQNGVENERLALRFFDAVYGMLVYLPAQLLEPGVVQCFSAPVHGVLDLGRAPSGTDARAADIAADLNEAGFAAQASDHIMAFKYAKLVSNTPNAVDAVLGVGQRGSDIGERVRAEARRVYAAAGMALAADHEMNARTALLSAMRPVNGTEHQGSSTWQSLTRGAGGIETDYLSGEIALLGRLHGVPTPVNTQLQRLAARASRERLPPGSFTRADVLKTSGVSPNAR